MATSSQYEEFIKLQKLYPRTVSNDYLLPSEIQKKFEVGNFSFSADEKALFTFERREGFSRLIFRIVDETAQLPTHDGVLAAYLTYRDGRYPDASASWLRGQGFAYTRTLLRHTAEKITGELSSEGIENASADEVYSMFGRYFDVVEVDFPSRELFDAESTYCVRSPDGEPLGIFYDMGRTRIIAVSFKARRQGIGRRLYLAYAAAKLRENGNHVFHAWINLANTASLALFRSIGFTPDTTMTDCFIRRGV